MANKNILDTIGPRTFVDFPDLGLKNIPAKVDTGADFSSIWASDIKDEEGMLKFKLFDNNSRFYNGATITTKDYSVTSIKNSFGDSEFRYKVRLQSSFGGRTIKATFTLANRSNTKYPVLIGARTLRGKFVVDVAKKSQKRNYEVLLLTSKKHKDLAKFVEGIRQDKRSINFSVVDYKDLEFYLETTKSKVVIGSNGRDLVSFDAVYFKHSKENIDVAVAVANYLSNRKILFFDEALANKTSTDKLYQYLILADNEIPIPKTIFLPSEKLKKSYKALIGKLGSPFILKDISANRGKNNFLIGNNKNFQRVCNIENSTIRYVAQKLIPNNGDYRVLIMGKRIKLVISRQRLSEKTHLNNISAGGKAKLLETNSIPLKVQKFSINAATLLKRNIAGVDVAQDKEHGSWYCFEVNAGAQLTDGAFVDEKQQAFSEFISTQLTK
ncbi:MAG TPA: RimK/LysX family protein [Candidatus Saccharimonadales bacterium]|nr:RimK/LysX family protein [Candidatus Saccharimonadales bacterium]